MYFRILLSVIRWKKKKHHRFAVLCADQNIHSAALAPSFGISVIDFSCPLVASICYYKTVSPFFEGLLLLHWTTLSQRGLSNSNKSFFLCFVFCIEKNCTGETSQEVKYNKMGKCEQSKLRHTIQLQLLTFCVSLRTELLHHRPEWVKTSGTVWSSPSNYVASLIISNIYLESSVFV